MKPNQVAEAMEQAQEPSEIRELFWKAEDARGALRLLATHAHVWDRDLLLLALGAQIPAARLLRNRSLPKWAIMDLAQWDVREMLHGPLRNGAPEEAPGKTLSLLAARRTLKLEAEPIQEVLQFLLKLPQPTKKPYPNPAAAWTAQSSAQRIEPACTVLSKLRDLPAETIDAVVRAVPVNQRRYTRPLLFHASCSPETIAYAIQTSQTLVNDSSDLNEHLFNTDVHRRHPEIRAKIRRDRLGVSRAEIWARLAADGLEDCEANLRLLLKEQRHRAAQALREHPATIGPRISTGFLAEMLAHPDSEVRLAAMLLTGARDPEQAPQSPSVATPAAPRR